GPHINAVGRMQDAGLAMKLMMAGDLEEALELAEMVQSLNKQRQDAVEQIVKEAEQMVHKNDTGVIIVAKEGWNEGVLGIVASQLVRKFDRPAIVLAIEPEAGQAKGSARSI